MKLPKQFIDSAESARIMEISYSMFQRLHAKEIEFIQLYTNGPRIFLKADVLKYKEGLAA
jgi:hypothetical protein